MTAADHELTGYRWHATAADQHQYLGRQRVLFASEIDIHEGRPEAHRLAPDPPAEASSSRPQSETRRVKLPGPLTDTPTPTAERSEETVGEVKPAVAKRTPEAANTNGR